MEEKRYIKPSEKNENVVNTKEPKQNNIVRHIRVGGVEATIWKNSYNGKTAFTVSLRKSYKDKNGDWKNTSTLRQNDLPKALLVLQKAFEYIALNNC